MQKQYKALKPIGRWAVGDIVGGLTDEQVSGMIALKFIEEVDPVEAARPSTKKTQGEPQDGK